MVPVCGGVAVTAAAERRGGGFEVRNAAFGRNMLSRPQQLRGFQQHLDDMFVAVRLGGSDGVEREKEDVHPAVGGLCAQRGQFFGRDR